MESCVIAAMGDLGIYLRMEFYVADSLQYGDDGGGSFPIYIFGKAEKMAAVGYGGDAWYVYSDGKIQLCVYA